MHYIITGIEYVMERIGSKIEGLGVPMPSAKSCIEVFGTISHFIRSPSTLY